jgi:hypothetical protein
MRPRDHDHGSVGVVRAAWWRRAGRQTRDGVTPEGVRHSQIGVSAALRVAKRLIGRSGCEEARSAPFPGFLTARLCVAARCGQPRSSSLRCGRSRLPAAARDKDGRDRGIPSVWSGPAVRVIAGLVTDQGVGDLVGAMGHRAADHPALLAAGPQPLAITAGSGIAAP